MRGENNYRFRKMIKFAFLTSSENLRLWEVLYTRKCTVGLLLNRLVVVWYTEKIGAFSTVHKYLKPLHFRINLRLHFSQNNSA